MDKQIFLINGGDIQIHLKPLVDELQELRAEVAKLTGKIDNKSPPKYLNVKEVCSILGISRSTLNRRVQQGDITAINVGRRVLFAESAIKKLLITKKR